ncbi:MAG: virulence RhuM family protein [Euryarchaeota archaeon]|nr:virulence RhuM family protein [Euryarchaeota archaeon]MDP3106007.1 virulence RhuM family protein [Candidatus Methanoperedens sp.]
MIHDNNLPEPAEFLLYQTEDGQTRLEVRLQDETVWLTQKRMAELFQKNVRTINEHIQNIFAESELAPESVIRNFRITADDGKSYDMQHYNLDVIISVGYRVKSHRGTQFRIWATQRLREYIIKGFAMDDDRLKQNGGGNYFDELLARIRDIRSSEKVFWRKVLDIYATSIDYDPQTETSQIFFATVQNKMHWAAHGQTAAEVIFQRADSGKENMGLTNWTGNTISKSEVGIAKNYLNSEELDMLNRIVMAYLEFAEIQALGRKPMYMSDWSAKLDDFLKLSGRELLTHAGKISHEQALTKAQLEYEKHRTMQINLPSPVEADFERAIKQLPKPGSKKALPPSRRKT